jgi:hypothetical protein
VQEPLDVADILHGERLRQAQVGPDLRDLARRGHWARHEGRGIAREQVHEHEDDRHDPHGLQRQQQHAAADEHRH